MLRFVSDSSEQFGGFHARFSRMNASLPGSISAVSVKISIVDVIAYRLDLLPPLPTTSKCFQHIISTHLTKKNFKFFYSTTDDILILNGASSVSVMDVDVDHCRLREVMK